MEDIASNKRSERQVEFEFPQGNDMLKRLQAIEFDMAVTIKDIFERNDIRYVIEYGSLLGAVRHGGFIPWDDDFDFVVWEDDYEKASDALRRELPSDKFVLHDRYSDPNYIYTFSKVRHLHSVALEEGWTDNLKYKGLSIDLFQGRIERNNRFARRLFLSKSHTSSHYIKFRSNHSFIEMLKVMANLGMFVCFWVLHYVWPKQLYFHKFPEFDQYFIPIDKYLPLSTIVFNGELFMAPQDPDYVLTDRYGNWRAFPATISFHLDFLRIDED